MVKKYCEGIDCQYCSEKEPCIYKIANRQAKIIEYIKDVTKEVYDDETTDYLTSGICFEILQKIREVEDEHNG